MRPTLVLTLVTVLLFTGCGGTCGNEIAQTIVSPSKALKAVVFSRNCGATTSFNTQVSIMRANEMLADEGGNTFIADGSLPIVVNWQSEGALHISGVGVTSPIKQSPTVLGVNVIYAK